MQARMMDERERARLAMDLADELDNEKLRRAAIHYLASRDASLLGALEEFVNKNKEKQWSIRS